MAEEDDGSDEGSDDEMRMYQEVLKNADVDNKVAKLPDKPPPVTYKPPAPHPETIVAPAPKPMERATLQNTDTFIPQAYYSAPPAPIKEGSPYIGHFGEETLTVTNLVQFMKPWQREQDTVAKLSDWFDDPKAARIAVVIGPTGSGKTTLARLMAKSKNWESECINPKAEIDFLDYVKAVYHRGEKDKRKVVWIVDPLNADHIDTDKAKSGEWKKFLAAVSNSKKQHSRFVFTLKSTANPKWLPHLQFLLKSNECHIVKAYSRLLKDHELRPLIDVALRALAERLGTVARGRLYVPTSQDAFHLTAALGECLKSRGGTDIRGAFTQLSFNWIKRPPQHNHDDESRAPHLDSVFSAAQYITKHSLLANTRALEACARVETKQLMDLLVLNLPGLAGARKVPTSEADTLDAISGALDGMCLADTTGPESVAYHTVVEGTLAFVSSKFQTDFYRLDYDSRERDARQDRLEVDAALAKFKNKCLISKVWMAEEESLIDVRSSLAAPLRESIETLQLLTPGHLDELCEHPAASAVKQLTDILQPQLAKRHSAMPVVFIPTLGELAPAPVVVSTHPRGPDTLPQKLGRPSTKAPREQSADPSENVKPREKPREKAREKPKPKDAPKRKATADGDKKPKKVAKATKPNKVAKL